MKKFNVWTKGPYSASWEKANDQALEKTAAAILGAEKSSGTATVKVAVVPANIDPNQPDS